MEAAASSNTARPLKTGTRSVHTGLHRNMVSQRAQVLKETNPCPVPTIDSQSDPVNIHTLARQLIGAVPVLATFMRVLQSDHLGTR